MALKFCRFLKHNYPFLYYKYAEYVYFYTFLINILYLI